MSQKERYLPMPDYDKSTATEVVLTLPGTVIDENYSLLLLLWDVLPDQLDDKQKEYKINNILRKLRKEGKISNTTIAGNKSTWALVKG